MREFLSLSLLGWELYITLSAFFGKLGIPDFVTHIWRELVVACVGRNLDRHSRPPPPSLPSSPSLVVQEARCELGRLCYVDTLYLTVGVCLFALGLSLWAGWRDWKRVQMRRELGGSV